MIIYGKQIFFYVLRNHKDLIDEIYLSKEVSKDEFREITSLNKKIIKLDNKKAQALANGKNHQGYFLKIDFTPINFDISNANFIVILSGISDVGNIGAIIRTAYSLGVDGVVISDVNFNLEGTIRSSSGAIFDMPILVYKNSLDLINELKQADFKIYGATANGLDVRNSDFHSKKALIVGSEGEGLSNKVIKKCDKLVAIKMDREFDSLNVSVATGILIDRIR